MPQLFLDLDGVLADFEGGAEKLLRMPAKAFQAKHGQGPFWKKLATAPDFYGTLDLLPDAHELMDGVRHLDPIILTGLPIGKWAEPQKRAWVQRHFPGVEVITTLARNKYTYCSPDDVLVDDQERYAEAWENAGGIFILHTDAQRSLAAVRKLGL
ncbi:MAG: hypothetical protein JNM62_08555 [Flavobacteriales bacterium]|nr:hypothetical protein [Flavobacteriales bacterium]